MNYYQARQRKTDGRWDFTCMNHGEIWPVGYCRWWRDWPEDLKKLDPRQYETFVRNRAKHHSNGHETREEAERCYWTYELDTRLRETASPEDEKHRCEAKSCQEWTQKGLSVEGPPVWLCGTHRTRETYVALRPFAPGVSRISST